VNATIGAALLLNPGELKAALPELDARAPAFVEHYNHRRMHESLSNLTPADVDFGWGEALLLERERIERQTIQRRRLLHHSQAA
jgi:putative transposase